MSIFESFVSELAKIAKTAISPKPVPSWGVDKPPAPGQQGAIGHSTVPKPSKSNKPTAVIQGPKGGLKFTKDLTRALAASRSGQKVVWGG